jgi:hypothetical protein
LKSYSGGDKLEEKPIHGMGLLGPLLDTLRARLCRPLNANSGKCRNLSAMGA